MWIDRQQRISRVCGGCLSLKTYLHYETMPAINVDPVQFSIKSRNLLGNRGWNHRCSDTQRRLIEAKNRRLKQNWTEKSLISKNDPPQDMYHGSHTSTVRGTFHLGLEIKRYQTPPGLPLSQVCGVYLELQIWYSNARSLTYWPEFVDDAIPVYIIWS